MQELVQEKIGNWMRSAVGVSESRSLKVARFGDNMREVAVTEGNAILVSLIDMGGRMRMIVNDVAAVKPLKKMPKLPVAGVMWQPMPNLQTSAEAWILAGGAHHSVMSYTLTADHMRDFAEMLKIEFIHINKDTDVIDLKKELMWNDIQWKLNN